MVKECRKCLLRDMNQEYYFENLHSYISQMSEDVKASQDLYEQRLKVCQTCDLLLDGMCKACGCFVELRGAVKKKNCPYEKW